MVSAFVTGIEELQSSGEDGRAHRETEEKRGMGPVGWGGESGVVQEEETVIQGSRHTPDCFCHHRRRALIYDIRFLQSCSLDFVVRLFECGGSRLAGSDCLLIHPHLSLMVMVKKKGN